MLYLQPHLVNDLDSQTFFLKRKEWARKKPAGNASITYVTMLYEILHSCGAWSGEPIQIHEQPWTKAPDRETIFSIARRYESSYSMIVDNSLQARYNTVGISGNMFLSLILRRAGIQASFRRKIRFLKFAENLAIVKCLTKDEHYQYYRYVVHPTIWEQVETIFDKTRT